VRDVVVVPSGCGRGMDLQIQQQSHNDRIGEPTNFGEEKRSETLQLCAENQRSNCEKSYNIHIFTGSFDFVGFSLKR